MTIFLRRFQRRGLARQQRLLAAATTGACLALSILTASASAVLAETEGTKVGVQPREVARYTDGVAKHDGAGGATVSNISAEHFENTSGNPVVHSAGTYLIFWDPQNYYHGDWRNTIEEFMEHAGKAGGQLESVFAVDAQYIDSSNQPAANRFSSLGSFNDVNPYPEPSGCTDPRPFETTSPPTSALVQSLAVCLTPAQIRAQLQTFISEHKLPKGLGTIYYILTPPGVAACLDSGGPAGHCSEFAGTVAEIEEDETKKIEPAAYKSYKNSFCSYHGAIENGNETILFGMIPWTAGGGADYQLPTADEQPGYPCQDGGFEPSKKPNFELLEKEKLKEKTPLEVEEYEAKDAEEKRKENEAEALGLQGPHNQEPNQRASKRSEDGAFDTGLADLVIDQIAVEQQNIVTDPLLDGWHDTSGNELTDECRNDFTATNGGSASANPETLAGTLSNNSFAEKHYYLNDAFNLAGLALNYPGIPCLPGVTLEPKFSVPYPANAGELLGLDGMASDVSLNWGYHFSSPSTVGPTYAVYTWNFGDGSAPISGFAPAGPGANSPAVSPCAAPWLAPCAGSTFHTYAYGGTYQVTLTIRDVAGNTASVTHAITVGGPEAPANNSGGSNGSSSSGSGSSQSSQAPAPAGAGGPGASTASIPAPVAVQAVVSHKLQQSLRKGLVVRYSVNEQVAGHFEVLLNRTVARQLGISGPLATGLPAGSPTELVIAKALLVTTKGGRSTVDILFSKTTAAKLSRLHKVSLMLRLVVRNAAPHSPATTTVVSLVTLAG